MRTWLALRSLRPDRPLFALWPLWSFRPISPLRTWLALWAYRTLLALRAYRTLLALRPLRPDVAGIAFRPLRSGRCHSVEGVWCRRNLLPRTQQGICVRVVKLARAHANLQPTVIPIKNPAAEIE